ncbi:MAG TPA: addiction module protein [Nannocystaceae bacterium]|nr:addiction module protein [Nannocystaceae bacterium]
MAASVTPPPGFDELPIEEKIAYVQALWDLIAQEPSDIPVPAWHEAVIAQRLAEARSSAARVRPWSEVRSELRARLHAARK